jgi:uncharacterized membrane protein YdbT with pleckstrin-like domain
MGYVEGLMGTNERIVVRTRQHWMVLASSFIGDFVASLVIIVGTILATAFGAMIAGPLAAFAPVLLLLLLFPLIDFLHSFLDWWNEEYMVTNRRVVQAEGTINKHVIDSSLEKVNDVVLNQSVLGRLLDYGDIEILTASEIGVNKLHKIASPVKFKTEMLNQKEALGTDEHFGHAAGKHDVPALIAELDELRKQGVLTETEFEQKKAQLLSKI